MVEADLTDANLTKTNLEGAECSTETIWPEGFDYEAAGVISIGETLQTKDAYEDFDIDLSDRPDLKKHITRLKRHSDSLNDASEPTSNLWQFRVPDGSDNRDLRKTIELTRMIRNAVASINDTLNVDEEDRQP